MIVIGTDLVESYFATRKGSKGLKAARAQFDASRAIAEKANWRSPQDVKQSHPKASTLKSGRVVFNIKGADLHPREYGPAAIFGVGIDLHGYT